MQRNAEEIRSYWQRRAELDSSAQSTTMDIWLRDIEARVLGEAILRYKPSSVADLGCGDGRTTISCAAAFPEVMFAGYDYANSMVENARRNAEVAGITNISFKRGDVMLPFEIRSDFVYTTRCLINLADWEAQQHAIANISGLLPSGGIYLMIENFVEGHENFNSLRKSFGLSEIPVRSHNCFFVRNELINYMEKYYEVLDEVNISSLYYVVSRVIYSSICAKEQIEPDYADIYHELGAKLPFLGEYGPVRALTLRKK